MKQPFNSDTIYWHRFYQHTRELSCLLQNFLPILCWVYKDGWWAKYCPYFHWSFLRNTSPDDKPKPQTAKFEYFMKNKMFQDEMHAFPFKCSKIANSTQICIIWTFWGKQSEGYQERFYWNVHFRLKCAHERPLSVRAILWFLSFSFPLSFSYLEGVSLRK